MKTYTMQDRSIKTESGQFHTDADLNLEQVLNMTDYSAEEIDKIADLQVGQEMLMGEDNYISIKRMT